MYNPRQTRMLRPRLRLSNNRYNNYNPFSPQNAYYPNQAGGSQDMGGIANEIINSVRFADPRTFIIFYEPTCRYSQMALQFLQSNGYKYRSFNISEIPGGLSTLLQIFNNPSSGISFNPGHRTKPIIFLESALVGGYNELSNRYS